MSLKAVASFPQSIVSLAAVFLLSQSSLNTKHATSVVGGAGMGWCCVSRTSRVNECGNTLLSCKMKKMVKLMNVFSIFCVACVASLAGFASVAFALECCVRC